MASTGIILAKNMTARVNDTVITCQVNAEVTYSTETFDTSCKDSGATAQPRPGTRSWTGSGTFLFAVDAAYGAKQLFDMQKSATLLEFTLGTGVTGDFEFVGDAYITSWNLASNGSDAAVEGSFELAGVGDPTFTS